jgi:hypothetical protein
MADDLESLQKLFEEKKVAPELFEAAKSLAEAEKARGIKETNKANKEAEKFRKAKIAFEQIARDFGIERFDDPESAASEIVTKYKSVAEKGGSIEGEVKALKSRLDKSELEKQQAIEKGRVASIKSKVFNDFNEKLVAPGLHLDSLISKGRLTLADDGESVVWKDGDGEADFKSGLQKYVLENKDSAKNQTQPGARSAASKSKQTGVKTITQAELDAMRPRQRAEFFKDGGELAAE